MLTRLRRRVARRATLIFVRCLSVAQRIVERANRPARPHRRRFIVLDPGLREYGGHHFEFGETLRRELGRTGAVTLYANAGVWPSVVATLHARPLFVFDLYPTDRARPFDRTYDEITRSMLAALRAIAPAEYDAQTVVIVHTMTVFGLGALAAWYTAIERGKRPRLFVQFQQPLNFLVEPSARESAGERAKALAATLSAAGEVRFATNSATLSEHIGHQLDTPCALMPVPIRWPAVDRKPPSRADATFGFFGGLRREKGALILAAAIVAFVAVAPNVRFIVHAPRGPSDPEAVRLLETVPQVELIDHSFADKADYFACLDRVRWILLPYDPEPYADRTSGIFLEAIGLGIPVIVTAGTWLARELVVHDAAGWIMPDFTAAALTAGLEHVHATLAPAADAPIPNRAVIDYHSPRNFCATLLRAFEP